MANKVIGITIALIFQLSLNTAADVGANFGNDATNLNYKNYIYINPEASVVKGDALFIESEDVFVEDEYDVDKLSGLGDVLNTKKQEPAEEVQDTLRVIDPNKPMIALTYDDGPSKYTLELLDVLKENNSAATFFVLGLQVNKNLDVIPRMIEDGNQIGNHSFNHKRLTTLTDEELYEQINSTDNLVYESAQYTPCVIRPPYGSISDELIKKLQRPIINWSIDTRDWENRNAEAITDIILKNVKDGDIILMHDIYETSLEASKKVIPELIERGYQLVTVSEMSEYRNVILKEGQSFYHMYK